MKNVSSQTHRLPPQIRIALCEVYFIPLPGLVCLIIASTRTPGPGQEQGQGEDKRGQVRGLGLWTGDQALPVVAGTSLGGKQS